MYLYIRARREELLFEVIFLFLYFLKNRDFFYMNIYNVKSASLLRAHNLVSIFVICNLYVLFSCFLVSIIRVAQESAFNEAGLRNRRDTREEK